MPPNSAGENGERGEAPINPSRPWIELPRDITGNILHRLGAAEILETAQKVCTTWRSVCKDPAMWRVIDMHIDGDLRDKPFDREEMFFHAVDRSQGQLVDINLEYYASVDWLDYIARRCSKLKRLRLARCDYLSSDKGLTEVVKRFRHLEELHIIRFFVSNEIIETFGRSCPLLRSFTLNIRASDSMGDENARAIARSMPGLRHLQLLRNGLTNKGLEAVLDGCPCLETLDLRCCYHVNLKGDLWKRCSTQIKCLRYPEEYISDNDLDDDDDDFHENYEAEYTSYNYLVDDADFHENYDAEESSDEFSNGYIDPDLFNYEDYINLDGFHL